MRQIGALCIVIVTSVVSSPGVMAIDQKAINDRMSELKMMSPVERDRLDRNIEDFQSLSNSQKAHFRSMHSELLDDRTHAGGLTAIMQTYSAWLNSLSPAQRDEVKNETDPVKKLAIVRRIKEENDHSKATQDPHPDSIPPMPNLRLPPKGLFDAKDVAAVVKAIAERLPASRTSPEFEQPQLENYIPIIQASIQDYHNPKEWPEDLLMQKMIAAIRTKDQQSMILKASSKRDVMIRLLLMGIMKQVNDQVHFPTEEERLQTYDSLTPAEREQIMSHPPKELRHLLNMRYFKAKGDESHKKIPEYRRKVIDLFERLEVQPPPGWARPKPRPQQDKS